MKWVFKKDMEGTYGIYSPTAVAMWRSTGRRQYPSMHCWVEAVGKHAFETDRDLYASVPLNIKIAGCTSSPGGNVRLHVSPVDKEWYQEACGTVRDMIGASASARVELKNALREDINELDAMKLAHVGEVQVYVNGKRYLTPSGQIPKLPRHASPHKPQHLADWYDGHRDALCQVVADHAANKSQQEVVASLADGGSMERAICAHLEQQAAGPAGESWPTLVQTYGMDRLARESDAHRSAQHVSKEVMQALCDMLEGSKHQVNAFYNRRQAAKAPSRGARATIFENDAIPLSSGLDTDGWANEHDMYHELAMDAFDQPALRDRIVELIHRQPYARAQDRLSSVRQEKAQRQASPLGNPMHEYEAEVHHPYFGTHPLDEAAQSKQAYYGDYHDTLHQLHLFEGLHPHPLAFAVETPITETQKCVGARMVPLKSKSTSTPLLECGMHKEDVYDEYHHVRPGRRLEVRPRDEWLMPAGNYANVDQANQHLLGLSITETVVHTLQRAAGQSLSENELSMRSGLPPDMVGHILVPLLELGYAVRVAGNRITLVQSPYPEDGAMQMGARAKLVPLKCGMHKKPEKEADDDDEVDEEYSMYHHKKMGARAKLVPLECGLHKKPEKEAKDDDEVDEYDDYSRMREEIGARLIPLHEPLHTCNAGMAPKPKAQIKEVSIDELPTFEEMMAATK